MIASLQASRPLTRVRPLTRDLLLALGAGLGVALAKLFLDFHLGVPGHAGVGWIAVLIASGTLGRPGVGVMAGLSAGLWGVPLGLNHSMAYNAMLYGAAGGAIDLTRLVRPLRLSNPFGAAAAGLAAHLAKLAFIITYFGAIGMVKHIHLFGLAPVAFNHALFGIAGGLAGWAVIRAARRARAVR